MLLIPDTQKVVTIPQEILEKGGTVRTADLPFKIQIKHFGVNCDFTVVLKGPNRGACSKRSTVESGKLPTSRFLKRRRTSVARD